MSVPDKAGITPDDVLDAAHALAPSVAARAGEIEAARRLPRDLLDDLIDAGCFRLLLPNSHQGLGADLPAAMRVLEVVSRADASAGWIVLVGEVVWLDVTGLPRATFDTLMAGGDAIGAGVFNPTGSIIATDSGYRANGRWSFASGCEHATWLYGNCVEGVVDGVPQLRTAIFTREQVVIEDTWHTSGLCGTGSHHFSVHDVEVPAEWTTVPLAGEPCIDDPVVRVPVPSLAALLVATVALGTAQGALDDILALAIGKVPLLSEAPLAANPHFQFEFATADTELLAARALLFETAASLWETACQGAAITLEQRARARAAAAWVTARCASVVEIAYRAGGGSSLYADCPLQRRLRDIHAITQHFLVKPDTLTTAGAILAGREVTVPVF